MAPALEMILNILFSDETMTFSSQPKGTKTSKQVYSASTIGKIINLLKMKEHEDYTDSSM